MTKLKPGTVFAVDAEEPTHNRFEWSADAPLELVNPEARKSAPPLPMIVPRKQTVEAAPEIDGSDVDPTATLNIYEDD